MKEISDTDVGFAYNGSPFIDRKNLRKLAQQFKNGKDISYLAERWDVSCSSIRYRLKQLGLYIPKKRW